VNVATHYGYCAMICRHECIIFVAIYLSHTYNLSNMNSTELKGNWNVQKSRLKQTFATLTDNDLLFAEGKIDELFAALQIKLGKTREELQKIIDGN
jgi:uncharacterized protein YjbJ (UPF0337 family)